ncbi:SUMF1/EgtB/PvdO family nonheme iron enzyme [Deltaproteobacteria bacterium TL4]
MIRQLSLLLFLLFALSALSTCGLGESFEEIDSAVTNEKEDWEPPTGVSLTILSANSSTPSQLQLKLDATDNQKITAYYLAEEETTPLLSAGGWQTVASSRTFSAEETYPLQQVDQTPTLYVWVRDQIGNISAPISTTDAQPPDNTSLSINNGDASSRTSEVVLSLYARDDLAVVGYYISETNTAPSATSEGWVKVALSSPVYTQTVPYTFQATGPKILYAWYKDIFGNVSASTSDEIIIADQTPPFNPAITINGGASHTFSTSISIALSVVDDFVISGYYLSEDATTPLPNQQGWIVISANSTYSATTAFSLSQGKGEKKVYVWFKDSNNNISLAANDTIELTEQSIEINHGDASSNNLTVTLTLSASDAQGVVGYYVSENNTPPSGTEAGWTWFPSRTAYAADVFYELSNSAGIKTLYAWFKNSEGKFSGTVSDQILLDLSTPSNPSIAINNSDNSTGTVDVSLNLSALDDTGIVAYYVSESPTNPLASDSKWVHVTSTLSYNETLSFILAGGDPGNRTVYVWFRDEAGNVSEKVNAAITLTDTVAPSITSITINNGDASTPSISVSLSLSAYDGLGVTAFYVSENSTVPTANASGWTTISSTTNYSAKVSFILSDSSSYGSRTVYVWFKDESGNVSVSVSDSITLQSAVLASADAEGMVKLAAGTFIMGDIQNNGESHESPAHTVTLSLPFYISDHEVTVNEYQACLTAGNCSYSSCFALYETYNKAGKEKFPMNCVSWSDTQNYLSWLNQNSSKVFRLCTEAEWEYAARSGTSSAWACGSEASCLNNAAWYSDNASGGTREVKTKQSNPWGLYDMYGNVWEWVQDGYSSAYSSLVSGTTDPKGPSTFSEHVLRGGHFFDSAYNLRAAFRNSNLPDFQDDTIGFRVCADVP